MNKSPTPTPESSDEAKAEQNEKGEQKSESQEDTACRSEPLSEDCQSDYWREKFDKSQLEIDRLKHALRFLLENHQVKVKDLEYCGCLDCLYIKNTLEINSTPNWPHDRVPSEVQASVEPQETLGGTTGNPFPFTKGTNCVIGEPIREGDPRWNGQTYSNLPPAKKPENSPSNSGASVEPENDLLDFVRDCRDNWDCDEDAHRYGTTCRVCVAKFLLAQFDENLPPWKKSGTSPVSSGSSVEKKIGGEKDVESK